MPLPAKIPDVFLAQSVDDEYPALPPKGDYDVGCLMIDAQGRGWFDRSAKPVRASVYQQLGKPIIFVNPIDDACEVSISRILLQGHRWIARDDFTPNSERWLPVSEFIQPDIAGVEGEAVPQEVLDSLKEMRFEKWPGFVRLKQRLEFLVGAMRLNETGHAFLVIDLVPDRKDNPVRFYVTDIKNVQLVLPANERDFEASGYRVRFAFSPAENSKGSLGEMLPEDFAKKPLHRVAIWAYSGHSNQLTCVYVCQILNEGTTQLYVESLGDGRYEFGFEANGNLFDSLLVSDNLAVRDEAGEDDQ